MRLLLIMIYKGQNKYATYFHYKPVGAIETLNSFFRSIKYIQISKFNTQKRYIECG